MSSPKSGKPGHRIAQAKQFGPHKLRLRPKMRQREAHKLVVAKASPNDVSPPDDGRNLNTVGPASESQQTSVIVTKRRPETKNNSSEQLSFNFSHITMTSKRPRWFA